VTHILVEVMSKTEVQGQQNKVETEENANRRKAMEITIDSLKLYITLSTVAIAGLLAFFNGNGKDGSKTLFFIAVIGFILCAIASVYTINTFINKVHNGNIDIRLPILRILNFIAIVFFVIGVVFCVLFFFSSKGVATTNNDSKIIIQGDRIEMGKDVKNKITITNDSLTKTKMIIINQ